MGDVFKAMQRASGRDKQEPQQPAEPTSPAEASHDAESAGLPLDSIGESLRRRETEDADEGGRAFSQAVEKAGDEAGSDDRGGGVSGALERSREHAGDAAPATRGAEPVNGYSPRLIVHHDRGSVITEQYRAIRTQILAKSRTRKAQAHAVTSSAPEEGKSVTTMNLGVTFSELRNQRTLVLEGDLRRPVFHKVFNRDVSPGLIQLLRGEIDDLDATIYPTVYDNFDFMPAGGSDFTSSTELLSSPKMVQTLERLRDRYDHIFVDTPPVVTVTDACILGAMCDDVLMVVRVAKTPVEAVDRAKRLLRAANCEIAGVVLTHMEYHIPKYIYRYV
jgi:capsular exopolysaccharide synthesis family protein